MAATNNDVVNELPDDIAANDFLNARSTPAGHAPAYRPATGSFQIARCRRQDLHPNRRSLDLTNQRMDPIDLRAPNRTMASSSMPRSILNPSAPNFEPTRVSSKRKAFSSAVEPVKSTLPTERRFATTPSNGESPIMRSDQLFETSSSEFGSETTGTVLDAFSDGSDPEFDSELTSLAAQTNSASRAVNHHPLRHRHVPLSEPVRPNCRASNTQRLAAILITHPEPNHEQRSGAHVSDMGRVKYLPLGLAAQVDRSVNNNDLTVLPSFRDRIDKRYHPGIANGKPWTPFKVPTEIFDIIIQHLARDDVKSMRLVSHEFEHMVSRSIFQSSVVPFNTELYDMIDEETKSNSRVSLSKGSKGKGKAKADMVIPDVDLGGLKWLNAKEDKDGKVYKGHGLKVFQGFGPHIKRFGMTFEVSETQLSQPPAKKELDLVESYHGSYDWPQPQYARFANLAGLERTADETSRMKAALANLEVVHELALSIDSGLGWLNGPDSSIRARIFERQSPIFGSSWNVPDHQSQAAGEFWEALQQSHTSLARLHHLDPNLKEVSLIYRKLDKSPVHLDGLRDSFYADVNKWPSIEAARIAPELVANVLPQDHGHGVLYLSFSQTRSGQRETAICHDRSRVMPNELRKEQKEWLLEADWAQRAFLDSYMLAVIDNHHIFQNVVTLNMAKLSSRFLPMLSRDSFWNALPFLEDVTLLVSPEWRSVSKDDAGFAETTPLTPSHAVDLFNTLLRERVANNESVRKLNVGWIGGGERAEGMFARNNHILPAPIIRLDQSTANSSDFNLVFKHVEQMTLSNCWITPPALGGLIKSHAGAFLEKLTLDSVSLTSHPRVPPVPHHPAAPQMVQQIHPFANAQPIMPQWLQQAPPAAALAHMQALQMQGIGNMQIPGAHGQHIGNLQQQIQQQMQQINQMIAAHHNLHVGGPNLVWHGNANFAPLPPLHQAGPVPAPPPQQVVNPVPAHFGPPVAQAVPGPIGAPARHWTAGHRDGSWPVSLNAISPGPIFTDYLPQPEPWGEQFPPRSKTSLKCIAFKSCGYAKLISGAPPFNQLVLEPDVEHAHGLSPWFRLRHSSLKPAMMESNDRYMAQIVQYIPARELNALQLAWGLREGWEDRWQAEAAEFDGLLAGGTGRFSGVIEKGMTLVAQPQT